MQWIGGVITAFALLAAFALKDSPPPDPSQELWLHRNLGKALYENPTTPLEAVQEWRRALDLAPDSARERLNYGLALLNAGRSEDGIAELERVQRQAPDLPHTWFNLGIAYKRQGRYQEARIQFEGMLQRVPEEPVSHHNLGLLLRLAGETQPAIAHFEEAARLNPHLAGPHYQLYTAYRSEGQSQQAARALATFEELKGLQAGAAFPEDMEWSIYAEVYDPLRAPLPSGDGATEEPRFQARQLDPLTGTGPGLQVLEVSGDGRPDLLVWTDRQIRLYLQGTDPDPQPELEGLEGVVDVAAGDFDNDGWSDLCILTRAGARLYANRRGRLQAHPADLPRRPYRGALWLDFDHDNDLDLFLFGSRSALMRNEGTAGFRDLSRQFPFAAGEASDGILFDAVQDWDGMDLLVGYRDGPPVLYRDRLGGRYEAVPLAAVRAGTAALQAADLNNDGWTDAIGRAGDEVVLLLNRQGLLTPRPGHHRHPGGLLLADLQNRGFLDLIVGRTLFRNQGQGRFDAARELAGAPTGAVWGSADFDGDGRSDLAGLTLSGELHLLRNESPTSNRWVGISLTGVRSLSQAAGAKVEVRSGSFYQKRTYPGYPLNLGVGPFRRLDTVRITWPNGLIQNEVRQPTGIGRHYREKQRLSGSCPTVFTWNGRSFQFIGEVLGTAPLGASAGGDAYLPIDPDEYLQIPGAALASVAGRYEIRITEELREVGYLDRIRLLAVDHPADLDLLTTDQLGNPPLPDFRILGVRERIHPIGARDQRGRDVLPRLLGRDRRYPDGFRREAPGVAEMHWLELDFGPEAVPSNDGLLVLHGWVDWADASSFVRMAQQRRDLVLPVLQVRDASGDWQTVIREMGIPAGRRKTIVVDLAGRFLSPSREIRIGTNLSLYWDEVFLAREAETAGSTFRVREVPLEEARLRFAGFSTPRVHPRRWQPEQLNYGRRVPAAMWNPIPGFYTRYGEVGDLLSREDDRYVIMGSGDEVQLFFEAARLPPPDEGSRRDFLLHAYGWVKDGDLNTAFARTVEPLPFRSMRGYPYPPGEADPVDAGVRRYREQYNTRPAGRVILPLAPP